MNQSIKGSQISSESILQQKVIKIIFVGESVVGKTSLLRRFQGLQFNQIQQTTIGVHQQYKQYNFQGVKLDLRLMDSPGQKIFQAFTLSQILKNDGVVLMYDITSKKSFEAIKDWVQKIFKYGKQHENTPMILVGNKLDLEHSRQVQQREGEKLAKILNISLFENSAKNGTSVNQEIQTLVAKIIVKKKENQNENENIAENETETDQISLKNIQKNEKQKTGSTSEPDKDPCCFPDDCICVIY